jgi:FlaA1/EpsC-like NDP-sugar epimerase
MKEYKILITGAAGSIGSALAMEIYKKKPKELVLVDQDETGIFYISAVLRGAHCLVGDITNKSSFEKIFKQYKPDVVYHCAAYKHVPIMELQKDEAVRNNIYGTKNLIDLSKKHKVKKFVFLSTDKAVNPSSIMGKTKMVCERICQSQTGNTDFIIVRFGNVLRSRGSVVEVFENRIRHNKPIEITDNEMERYFLTMREAISLLIKSAKGKNRDLFVWNMGKPKKIIDLAYEVASNMGKKPKVVLKGMRPGEKLTERLFNDGEIPVKFGNYFIVKLPKYSLNLKKEITFI